MRVKLISFVLAFFLSLMLVSAITASLDNSRMVLRLSPGETIEKYIQVNNVNEGDIKVDFFVTGALNKSVNIKTENNMTLQSGENKKVYFTIKAPSSGSSETKINFRFSSLESRSGVGLSATIIVVVEGTAVANSTDDVTDDLVDDTIDDVVDDTTDTTDTTDDQDTKISISPLTFLYSSTGFLVVVLIILFFYLRRVSKSGASKGIKPKKSARKYAN